MTPTPVSAFGVLELSYQPASVVHRLRLRTVVASLVSGAYQFAAGSRLVSVVAEDVASLVKVFLATGTPFLGYTFYHDVSGVLLPLETGAIAAVGSNGSPTVPASQSTYSFRCTTFKRAKIEIFDGTEVPPFKNPGPYAGGRAALIAGLTSLTGTNPANYIVGRDGSHFASVIEETCTYNRKMLRRYGL